MFAVIYKFKLQPHQEAAYRRNWQIIAHYFKENCGALGSCLHKGEDGLWLAYSRWPDSATRDKSWPKGKDINPDFPPKIQDAIQDMLLLKEENKNLENYNEITLEVIEDLLT